MAVLFMGRSTMGKLKMSKAIAALMTAFLITGITGCGSSANSGSGSNYMSADMAGQNEMAVEEHYAYMEEGLDSSLAGDTGQEGLVDESGAVEERKRIRTVSLTVETKDFDGMLISLDRRIEESGGYVEQRNTYYGSSYSTYSGVRQAGMTVRIPSDKLDTFLNMVSGIGNVVRRDESEEDVTLKYVDLESHKKALETEQARLLELLGKAESVEDIITIESRLSEVRYQIESMVSQLRTYDNKVDYSTVYLDIEEVKELTPVTQEGAWERITRGFAESVKSVMNGLAEFGIWFLIKLPYLLVWALVIGIILFILMKLRKGKKRKKELMAENSGNDNDNSSFQTEDKQVP